MNLDLNERIVIKNLCEWDLFFPNIDTIGTTKLPRRGVTRLTRGEVQAQVYADNKMFTGLDGKGTHAKILIDDKATRVAVGFESEDGKETQDVLTPEKIAKLLELKTLSSFKKNIEESVKLQSEKLLLVEEAKKLKINDHDKIKFIEEHTGYKFN